MKLVIMCGGSGTRLWPISRTSTPKQFVKLIDGKSLFELTIERNEKLVDGLIVVVNEKQLELCQTQIPARLKDKTQFIIEPVGRNTAPAICLAALSAQDDMLLVVASDHHIKDLEKYTHSIEQAQKLAEKSLVTFGLKPSYPETGFGYIEHFNYDVISFKEKPDLETAKTYVSAGNFLWNSGMFCFHADVFLKELQKHHAGIYDQAKKAFAQAQPKENVRFINKDHMLAIPKDSIDYAVMEKSELVKVVPSDFYWSDLGSFDALDELLEKDQAGNTQRENSFHIQSKNNLIIGGKKVIATFDVEDLIIVETDDALLVGKKGESQKVKELLELIKKDHQDLLD
ncbi:MAG: mannose-1-phosphate guanylyltransferase/mannose-6-phosphate isomerase [Halobacteriovoraceae bacterium]|nr:mannose-1-phosphate guanylyltransferase/mannose-6-phosphate isomerase [Halobacteriovoraceae bacterium]|tara:strand:- start:6163 stop:7188 length:1026 start_codon:yes stop_codon:yes gene_type:complete